MITEMNLFLQKRTKIKRLMHSTVFRIRSLLIWQSYIVVVLSVTTPKKKILEILTVRNASRFGFWKFWGQTRPWTYFHQNIHFWKREENRSDQLFYVTSDTEKWASRTFMEDFVRMVLTRVSERLTPLKTEIEYGRCSSGLGPSG